MAESMYKEVEGFYIHVSYPDECVRSALHYKPQPGDVFVVSYPKCGTTWIEHIVYHIFNGRSPPKDNLSRFREMPFLEFQGADSVRAMVRPGSIKTHMPFRFQPYSMDAKYIYICRNPYDCCVSFFYYTKAMPKYKFQNGTFEEFFEMFIEGKVNSGDYFDHVLSWYKHRNDPNVLFLTYEDLNRETATWVLKIADFLGEKYGQKLRDNREALAKILKRTSVKTMKKDVNGSFKKLYEEMEAVPEEQRPQWARLRKDATSQDVLKSPMSGEFVRKGVVGDWRNHFSADQIKRLKERIELKTPGSDLMRLWKDTDIP